MANVLTDPPFIADPPIKINVNAKILGLVIGILALIGAVLGLVGLLGALTLLNAVNTLTNICNATGVSCGPSGIFVLALVGFLVVLIGDIMGAIGGFQMYNLNREGKNRVIYGLALTVVGAIVEVVGYSSGFIGSLVFSIVVSVVIWYLVIVSRFPGEAPLVANVRPGGYGSPPPPPPA